jgi:aerotaxis receptor
MKVNLPVTSVERKLVPGRPIVTKTDLKGTITYCNQSFVDISGFSRDELLGSSHNMVRHPDMPTEAFDDLWRTIKAGHPWCGAVKNRAKNGDYYWVDAYVTPVTENGRCVGYMSVRTPVARAAAEAAESLYRAVKAKQAVFPGTRIASGGRRAAPVAFAVGTAIALLSLGAGLLDGRIALACGIAGAVLVVAGVFVVYSRLLSPMRALAEVIERIDEGRLDQSIISPGGVLDDTYARLEGLRIHLRAMFADVLVSARDVAERSSKLDESMRTLGASSDLQNENVMRVSAAMEEMSVAITEISSNTGIALAAARRTEEVANAGMVSMAASIDSNRKASEVVSSSSQRIAEVNTSIGRIASISQIIREIADQTNLLALNAAIEAARAGDQGRGFAVVADEVRKLAERTALSTVEIASAIEAIVGQSRTAVSTMSEASHEVNQGTVRVEESSGGLKVICEASREAVSVSGEITDMLRQQSTTSHEVANSMEHVSAAADASRTTVAEVSAAASGLRQTAEELRLLLRHMESAVTA